MKVESFTYSKWYTDTQEHECSITVLCDADLKKILKALKEGKTPQQNKKSPDLYIHTIIYIFSIFFNGYFGPYSKKLNWT